MKAYALKHGLGIIDAYNDLLAQIMSHDGEALFVPVSREVKQYLRELADELNITESDVIELIFRRAISRNIFKWDKLRR